MAETEKLDNSPERATRLIAQILDYEIGATKVNCPSDGGRFVIFTLAARDVYETSLSTVSRSL